ncbi:MAG: rod shape-determining protein MreD [Gemmatimonadaceae bacterium]
MITVRSASVTVVIVVLISLQFTLRPLLDWRAGVDFLVIALLVLAVRTRPGLAALAGFAMGLVSDAMSPESLGAGALALTVVGFTASRLKAAFFTDNVGVNAVFVFLGKCAADIIFLLAEQRLGGGALLAQLLVWTPLGAALTALVGVVVLALVRPTLERRRT